MANALQPLAHIDLGVTGMTCTSCSSRVERKLNKVDGVEATVNFATESASVAYDPTTTTPEDLIKVVEGAGYGAFSLSSSDDSGDEAEGSGNQADDARAAEAADLLHRTWISGLISLPVSYTHLTLPTKA